MKSSNGRYEVVKHDFSEARMGSPLFGRIEIRGASFNLDGRHFGEPMAFSTDSRFLATEQLISTASSPHTQSVVFDFEHKRQIIVHDQNPGLLHRFTWSPEGLLTIISWTHLAGEREHFWQAPAPKPQSFLKKIFG